MNTTQIKNAITGIAATFLLCLAPTSVQAQKHVVKKSDQSTVDPYPYTSPRQKPDRPLSSSMHRVWDVFGADTPQRNELYTTFHYTEVTGLDYSNHDGTITRRDPSRIVKANGKYYVWYTYRNTPTTFVGPDKATDTLPSVDWDLCDIWYATSTDGYHWEEQGVAVPRPPKPTPGFRSVSTPDVLFWKGKYYLYYQAFSLMSGKQGADCPVAMSWADSPDGPWHRVDGLVIPNGKPGTWDQYAIHDPQPIVYKDKIYMYWKSDYNGKADKIRSTGLAIGDNPMGPFKKCELNPVISSGHETQLFRFRGGIASVMERDGHEGKTVQFAPDGINFSLASVVEIPPKACGWYDPDAFTNVDDADGVTWGLCHFTIWGKKTGRSILLRVDCDLTKKEHEASLKKNRANFKVEDYLKHRVPKGVKAKRIRQAKEDLGK